MLLEHINGPEDLKKLTFRQTEILAQEIREFIIENAQKANPSISTSVTRPINRDFFFHQLEHKESIQSIWDDCSSNALNKRIHRFLYRKLGI